MAGCAGRGLDLVAIAGIWPRSPIGIFSLKEANITKPKDLEGQSVGSDVGGGEFQLWPAFVKATGIDAKKVNIVSMDAPGLMRAVADKQLKIVGISSAASRRPSGPTSTSSMRCSTRISACACTAW